MRLNYEPLEKGKEYDVDPQIAKIWIDTKRAHPAGGSSTGDSGDTEKASGDDAGDSCNAGEETDGEVGDGGVTLGKPSGKPAPQTTANKKAKEEK